MDFNVNEWLDLLMYHLRETFGERLLFAGHTGSFARGEAGENSDIDVNVVLDKVDIEDLIAYRQIVKKMPLSKKACGFICSVREIKAWPRHELFHFVNGCKNLYGNIFDLIDGPDKREITDYIRNSSSAILHETRHKMIYSEYYDPNSLEFSYKNVFFILQATLFLKLNRFILTRKEMFSVVYDDCDRTVLEININWNKLEEDRLRRPEYYFRTLIEWCSKTLVETQTY
ncbi:MAG: nucleotidyltransferase domain-containing protein [Candidatus Eremiobacterota bacterium]